MLVLTVAELSALIREQKNRLLQIQSEILKLQIESGQIQKDLSEAREELGDDPANLAQTRLPARQRGNSTTWAVSVLHKAGEPLHANHIVDAIWRDFSVKVQPSTLVGNISRLVKRGKIFERTGPNTFGLLDWAAEQDAKELFGREEYEEEHRLENEEHRLGK